MSYAGIVLLLTKQYSHLLLLLLCLFSGFCHAGERLAVDANVGAYELERHIEFVEDDGWAFETVLNDQDVLGFHQAQSGALTFGYVDSSYWFRLTLYNASRNTTSWVLELSGLGRSIDQVEAYIPDLSGTYRKHLAGDSVPFATRSISHHAILFMVDLPPTESRTLFLKIRTNGTLQLPLKLWSTPQYVESEHHDMLLEGMFFGVLVIMLFYNSFIYWSVKDHSYFFYVCYLLCLLGFSLSIKGVGFEYLWPANPAWNNKSNLVFAMLGGFFVLLFAKSFLKTRIYTPRIDQAIRLLLFTGAVCFVGVFLVSHYYAATLISVQYGCSVLAVILAASFSLKRGFTAARYYLLAWLSVLISILLWILNSFNVVTSYWVGSYLFQIGTTLQVLLFSFALADRINLMRSEREAALKMQLDHSKRLVSMAQMFERFVPKQFLSRIARSGIENIELGKAEVTEISVLFADIRGFTTLSESLEPQELLNFLNAYLARIDDVIHQYDGFIDKFVGDGVMAIFEDTKVQHAALNSVNAAIAMQKAVDLYNQHRANSGYPPITIGVGVNTGVVVIGTVGSQERMDSTVLGDNVNVAARLQDLTKELRARVIISEHTLEVIGRGHGLILREVGDVQVRGRREPVHIFEVLNADSELERNAKLVTLGEYRMAYENYRNGRWQQAQELWQHCLEVNPNDSIVSYLIRQCKVKNDSHLNHK